MKSVAETIKNFADFLKFAAEEKYKLHGVRIYFSAPPKTSTETVTLDKGNFQWVYYQILFTDPKMNRYIYQITLQPWGETGKHGVVDISKANATWKVDQGEIDLDSEAIKKIFETTEPFKALLKGPDLFPKVGALSYVNTHVSEKGKSYLPEQFKKQFDDEFYALVSKTKELVTPFGDPVGATTPGKEEGEIKESKEDYYTGGFDIMKKLFKKQHKHQDIKKKSCLI